MRIILLILTSAFFSSFAFAARPPQLSEGCKEKLSQRALDLEAATLEPLGLTIERAELRAYVNRSTTGKLSVGVLVEDLTDGKYATYGAAVTEEELNSCQIDLKRNEDYICRFSSSGEEELVERAGLKILREATLKPTTPLSSVEEKQIRTFLVYGDEGATVGELIESTDDGYITKTVYLFPNGKEVEFYKAYGGDNPYGIYFEKGTEKVVGTNGDDSICIGYNILD